MVLSEKVYVDNEEIKKLAEKYKIFIFGAGKDGKQLYTEIKDAVNIEAFVDNYKCGSLIEDVPIISLNELKIQKNECTRIVVASKRFWKEIIGQLEKEVFRPQADFYIWDQCDKEYYYHYNEDIRRMIEHNQKVWGKKEEKRKNQIILPFLSIVHDIYSVAHAYCGNYLAEKYDADMYCFSAMFNHEIYESVKDIYISFGVKGIIEPILSAEKEKEAEMLAEELWNSVESMEDWNKLYIYDIPFGITIIRHFLRYYMPTTNFIDEAWKPWFIENVKRVVFLNDYLEENNVKAVVLWDAVREEGYLRDLAIVKGIPVYKVNHLNVAKATFNLVSGREFKYYKKFWNELTPEEQEEGIKWSKERLENRLHGSVEDIMYVKDSPYASKEIEPVLIPNDKIKILICPHSFEDDSLFYGDQIFDDNLFEWLWHLGELSNQISEYDWYLKSHIGEAERSLKIIEMFKQKYPNINILPSQVSPWQLKKEGINVALTVAGTLGHEYPMIGIPVINAGANPHMAFSFNFHPKTKEEYDNLIRNFKNVDKKIDIEEIYQFYCIHYLYYKTAYAWTPSVFVKNPDLQKIDYYKKDKKECQPGTHRYRMFLEEWTPERHEEIKKNVEKLFEWLDEWREDVFYRKGIDNK